MGGVKEYNTMTGRTVGQAFDRLREELLEEHGHDYYAGHQGNNELDTRKIFKSEKELNEYMERQENNGTYYKGTSFAYEIVSPKPNTNKTKTQVNRFPNKGIPLGPGSLAEQIGILCCISYRLLLFRLFPPELPLAALLFLRASFLF